VAISPAGVRYSSPLSAAEARSLSIIPMPQKGDLKCQSNLRSGYIALDTTVGVNSMPPDIPNIWARVRSPKLRCANLCDSKYYARPVFETRARVIGQWSVVARLVARCTSPILSTLYYPSIITHADWMVHSFCEFSWRLWIVMGRIHGCGITISHWRPKQIHSHNHLFYYLRNL
jgi:hypothetical protein